MYPYAKKTHFRIEKPFNIKDLLNNKMMIFVGIGILMMICMKNLPDMEELQKAQAEAKKQN